MMKIVNHFKYQFYYPKYQIKALMCKIKETLKLSLRPRTKVSK